MSAAAEPTDDTAAGLETGLSIPVETVSDLLAPWRSTALTGTSPHHVTVLYPWMPPPLTDDTMEAFAGALRELEPFRAELTGLATFDSGVVYLTPEPRERFAELTAGFCRLFPTCTPYHGLEPVPHLTAARIPAGSPNPEAALEQLTVEVRETVRPQLPISFEVEGVSIGQSDEHGRWSRRSYHRFGEPTDGV